MKRVVAFKRMMEQLFHGELLLSIMSSSAGAGEENDMKQNEEQNGSKCRE